MSLETLWDRVNDAINTIIRRDESTETGELLPPCIEGTNFCFVLDPSLLICFLGFPHCGSILAQAWFFTLFAMRTSSK